MIAIILTEEELQQKINEAVEKALEKAMSNISTKKVNRKTGLDINEAVEYLNGIGYKCSYSLMYKLSMRNEIPLTKFGRRNMFNTADLDKWVETKKQKLVDVSGNVSRSAPKFYKDLEVKLKSITDPIANISFQVCIKEFGAEKAIKALEQNGNNVYHTLARLRGYPDVKTMVDELKKG